MVGSRRTLAKTVVENRLEMSTTKRRAAEQCGCAEMGSGGLGLFLTQCRESGGLVVASLLAGGAAQRSGQICVGDTVVAVCGTRVDGMQPADAVSLILAEQSKHLIAKRARTSSSKRRSAGRIEGDHSGAIELSIKRAGAVFPVTLILPTPAAADANHLTREMTKAVPVAGSTAGRLDSGDTLRKIAAASDLLLSDLSIANPMSSSHTSPVTATADASKQINQTAMKPLSVSTEAKCEPHTLREPQTRPNRAVAACPSSAPSAESFRSAQLSAAARGVVVLVDEATAVAGMCEDAVAAAATFWQAHQQARHRADASRLEVAQIRAAHATLQQEAGAQQTQMDRLLQEKDACEQESARLRADHAEQRQRIACLQACEEDSKRLGADNAELRQTIACLQACEEESKRLGADNAELRQRIACLQACEEDSKRLGADNAELRQRMASLQAAAEKAGAKEAALAGELEQVRGECCRLRAERAVLDTERAQERAEEPASLGEAVSGLVGEVAALQAALQGEQRRREAAERESRGHAEESAGLRQQLAALQADEGQRRCATRRRHSEVVKELRCELRRALERCPRGTPWQAGDEAQGQARVCGVGQDGVEEAVGMVLEAVVKEVEQNVGVLDQGEECLLAARAKDDEMLDDADQVCVGLGGMCVCVWGG